MCICVHVCVCDCIVAVTVVYSFVCIAGICVMCVVVDFDVICDVYNVNVGVV